MDCTKGMQRSVATAFLSPIEKETNKQPLLTRLYRIPVHCKPFREAHKETSFAGKKGESSITVGLDSYCEDRQTNGLRHTPTVITDSNLIGKTGKTRAGVKDRDSSCCGIKISAQKMLILSTQTPELQRANYIYRKENGKRERE